ncbi:hypothetical protein NPS01_42760 [Nocardioides psychrotolerans]|uniref:Uncharacterized protein n=1 Tax=Nocardioides psychrotolerans TaxID=1005945 RepID=A0A1I3MAH9_9ACTN|nr:hypothetical protein [Nocardioides psychrotolerans]GEP40613.1 hypothetical protein NPS01_42760 [Nocardioides psychrotolerans]SFI93912.1 hypothetical protein SAMN05216561_11528 [Nocardioides psychrotolerans]
MTMTLPRYTVLVADVEHPGDPDHASEHQVTILHGDQLRAELEGPRNMIPGMDKAPMHGITLWLWAALMRTHAVDQPFQEFLPRLLAFEDATQTAAADVDGLATPADPTQPPVGSGSPSVSPSTSVTSTDGWPVSSPTPTG